MKHKRDEQTAKRAEELGRCGLSNRCVASVLGLSVDTLDRYYRGDLERGRALSDSRVAKRLFEKAMEGDVRCLIFWAKARMGWQETPSPDPAASGLFIDPSRFTAEQLRSLRGLDERPED